MERGPVMFAFTTPLGVLLSLQLAAPPAPPPAPDPAPASTDAPAADADLAAEAPVSAWVPEGGAQAHRSDADPGKANKRLRNTARTSIAGGAIALLGVGMGAAGLAMYMVPRKQLAKLRTQNDGVLPPDDAKRQRAITLSRVGPALGYAGMGVMVTGILIATIAGARFKKLRADKRTTVAFHPMQLRRGGGIGMEVRF